MAKGVPIQGKNPSGKAQLANVTAEGDLKVQLSGAIITLYKSDIGDRPAYNTINQPTLFVLMPQLNMWYTDGSVDWTVV